MAGDLNLFVDLNTQQAANQVERLFNEFRQGSKEAGDQLNKLLGGSVEKKVRIRLEKDTAGLKQVKAELVEIQSATDAIARAYAQANKTQPGSITSLRQQVNEAKRARDAIGLFSAEIDKVSKKQILSGNLSPAFVAAQQNVSALTEKLRTLELATSSTFDKFKSSLGLDQFLRFGRGVQDLVTIFQSLGIAVSALTAPINQAANALARLQGLELAFQAIGAGAGGASIALNESKRIALGLGVSLDTVRNGFQKLSPVILNSGGTLNDVSSILESLSSRFAAFGLNADESRRVMNGVIQAFAKGKLQAEELTQQISEADPAFKTDLAKALLVAKNSLGDLGKEVDGTVANLEGLVKKGEITSEVLIKVLPLLSKSSTLFGKLGDSAVSAVQSLGKSGTTITQVRTQLDNLNQLNLERLANIFKPVIESFLLIQAVVTDFITRVSKLEVIQTAASVIARLTQAIANLTEFILNGIEGLLRFVDGIGKVLNVIGRLLGPIADFAGALANVPGLLETIGLLLLAKFIRPAKEALLSVASLTNAINDFGKTGQLKISLPDEITKDFKEAAAAIKGTFKPEDIAKGIDEGTSKINTIASTRLKELRAKFREAAVDISTPIQIQEPVSPKKLGISQKVLKEVQESKTSLSELFRLKGTLEKELGNIIDPDKRRLLFTEEAGQQILEYSSRIDELNDKIDNLTEGPTVDTKEVQKATKEIETLQDRIDGLQSKIDDTDFTPDIDARQYRATERALASVEKQITNIQKVRQVDLKALVDDKDVINAIKNTDLLRGLYQKKLELEANIITGIDTEGALRELEDVKRTIRTLDKIEIPVTTNAGQVASDIALSRSEIDSITNNLVAGEDEYFQSLQRQKDVLTENLALSKQRLDLIRAGADNGDISADTARTIYQDQERRLGIVSDLQDKYIASQRNIINADSQAASILDGYNSRLLTQNQALAALSTETAKYTDFQSRVKQAVGNTEARLASLTSQLAAAQKAVQNASFKSLDAEKAAANVSTLEQAIGKTQSELNLLKGVLGNATGELENLASTTKAVSSAEFRLGEKISNSLKPVKGAADGISKAISSAIDASKQKVSGFASSVTNTFAQIKADGFKGTVDKIGSAFVGAGVKAGTGLGNALSKLGTQLKSVGNIDVGKTIGSAFDGAKRAVSDFGSNAQRSIGTFAANAITSATGAATNIGNAFRKTGSIIKGLFASIGPELAIFAAIAVATSAYNKVTERSSAINEETAATVERLGKVSSGLKDSLAALSGEAASSKLLTIDQEFSGLEKVLIALGDALLLVQKFFAGLFSFLDEAPAKAGKASNSFEQLGKQLLIIAGFTAAGAAIGSVFAGIGALPGAVIGAGIGAFVAATAGAKDYGAALSQAKKEQEALVESAGKTAQAVRNLANEISNSLKEAKAIDAKATGAAKGVAFDTAQAQGISAYQEASKAVQKLQSDLAGLRAGQAEVNKIVAQGDALTKKYQQLQSALTPLAGKTGTAEYQKLREEFVKTSEALQQQKDKYNAAKQFSEQYKGAIAQLAIQEEIARLAAKQLAKDLGLTEAELKKIAKTSFAGIKEEIEKLQTQVKALNFDKSDQIIRLSQRIGALKADFEALENISKQGELEGYFRRLTELIANGRIKSSIQTVNNLIKNLQEQIELLDFTKPEDLARIDELATKMGRLSAIVEVVENRVTDNKLAGYIEQIRLGLANDEIPRSLTTIGNLVQALEQRQLLIDIDSPELPEVTAELIKAQQGLANLNGKKADITLQVIQEGIANGDIIRTLSVIDQQIEALNQKKLSLPVNSAGYVEVLDQIKTIERQRQLSEQTTDDLLERKYNIQKERIDALASLEKAKSDQRIALIDREIDKVKTFYDEQIKALEKFKGPAEKELEAVKLAELQQKAKQPGRDGLEARAELERLQREKEIARLKEEQERKVAALEKIKKQEQDRILDKELKVAEQRLALEEKITALRLKGLAAEEADIDKILNERATNAGTADGKAYGTAFNTNAQNVIREASQNEQDPASLVRFNFDNTQVIEAQNQVIAKEKEYQGVLNETNAIKEQLAAAPQADFSVGAQVDQLIAKEQELTRIGAEQYQLEEQYNQALRDTATTTGEIVLDNQSLVQQLTEVNTSTSEISATTDEVAQGFFDINAAATDTQATVDATTASAQGLGEATGEVADKQVMIGDGVEKAAGKFAELKDTVIATGGEVDATGERFDGAAQKVNSGLLPALEKVPATLEIIQSKMNEIFDREYTVNVKLNVQKQGVWTGGPVSRGTAYTVNELGQEGFMNRFGNISPIKKPRYGTWRPPSDGFVIPADIYSQIRDRGPQGAPGTSVSYRSPVVSGGRRGQDSSRDLARMMTAVVASLNGGNDFNEMSKVQAHQAKEIGKLSRAVQDLADKDWNVKVGVRNSGNLNSLKLSTYRI